jgi:hypothetical protein
MRSFQTQSDAPLTRAPTASRENSFQRDEKLREKDASNSQSKDAVEISTALLPRSKLTQRTILIGDPSVNRERGQATESHE